MAETLTPDICVIGAGSGGLSVAAAAAAFGVPVVLIEKGKMGGECLNSGCVPSKATIAAGKRAHALEDAARFGVEVSGLRVDFARVREHVQSVIAQIAPNDSKERFTALGVRVIEGEARFTTKNSVSVGDIEIKARRFVIASGSSPALPPIAGLEETPYFTNDTIFDLAIAPSHLLVVGAGAVGLELAQAFRRLGSSVTIIEAQEPLRREDRECAAIVLTQLEREGVTIRSNTAVESVSHSEGKVRAVIKGPDGEETIEGSHLLITAGRRPKVDGLDLEKAGIRYSPSGIRVDRGLRTSNRRVYAIGDVIGAQQFTHVANYHAGLVIRNALFRLPAKTNEFAIPRVVFTDPEFAQVGLTERQMRERKKPFRVLRWPYHENDRAQAEREIAGHIKVLTSRTGQILGASIVGAQAGEIITIWTLAIGQRLNIRAMAGVIVPYPTLSEIGKRAAVSFFAPRLTSSWVRRIMIFLRKFG
jgi:pyruvate/2-oxoglutarate dehydrogenase complex dihydrolipoamide dehydrogenase (E3) component